MRTKENTIIVIGGEGFVGHALIKQLVKVCPYKIISLDCQLTDKKVEKLETHQVEYIKTNLIESNKTSDILKLLVSEYKVDCIFHFGEYSRVVASLSNIDTVIESNVKLTIDVINICMKNAIRLIYSASSTKFDVEGNVDYNTLNKAPYPYFKSFMVDTIKRFGEWYNLDYNIAYFYNVYGPGQVREGEFATVIGIWNKQFINKEFITVIGDGSQTRDFTHIDDIVDGLIRIYDNGKTRHEYHLGTGVEHKLIDLASLYGTTIKYLPKIDCERKRGKAPVDSLARTELGWEPKHDIVEYIKSFVSQGSDTSVSSEV